MREITKEELTKRFHGLTVGELKEFLLEHNIPDNAVVVTQRVEDVYYEKHNWGCYLKEGEHSFNLKRWNEDIDSGKYLNKEEYPNMNEENLLKATSEEIKNSMEKYTIASSCVFYKEDPDILFIDLHY